jgi:mono/diheme cytochrome c family protein
MRREVLVLLVVVPASLLVILSVLAYLGLREDRGPASTQAAANAQDIERGAYLARAGNCKACHTARGGDAYAGGRAIHTPFGAIYSSNLTPDHETGLGAWTAEEFWRALHNGKSRDGTLLYPAFPFPNFSSLTRADSDAMYAYFHSMKPVRHENRVPELRFPFNHRALLIAWRALYFRPEIFQDQQDKDPEWNRGAYLVQGLGHCSACHTKRNLFGAQSKVLDLGGGMIPMANWYASSLTAEHGARSWTRDDLVDFMQTGISARGVASGPMAEVVRESLQHLDPADLFAMASYLQSLTPDAPTPSSRGVAAGPRHRSTLEQGAAIYEEHCVECHKASGAGEPPHFPALAANSSLLFEPPVNPVRLLLHGGYAPSTAINPYPFGMPPFGNLLSDEQAAAVLSYVRNAWGNQASMVSSSQVNRLRPVIID